MDQVDIIGKLSDLSSRIEAKEQLSVKYKELVKSRLAVISDKIKKLLARQKNMIVKIKDDSKTQLTALGKKLGDMKNQVKQQGDEALRDAEKNNKELQDNLDRSVNDIAELRRQLLEPNPDLENMRELVKKLEEQLKDSTNKQDEYEFNMKELRSQLEAKDATIEQLTTAMTDAINMIVDLITKVEKMSINDQDIEEITKLLDDVEKQLDESETSDSTAPGSDDGDLGIADMFQDVAQTATEVASDAAEAVTEAAEKATENVEQEVKSEEAPKEEELSGDEKALAEAEKQPWWKELTDAEKVLYGKPQGRSQRRGLESDAKKRLKDKETTELEEGIFKDVEGEEPAMVLNPEPVSQDSTSQPNNRTRKTREERQELSNIMNQRKNKSALDSMIAEANKGGKYGKTRRHKKKGKKTIRKKKGGYVNKKVSIKHKKDKKKKSDKTTKSSSKGKSSS